MTKINQAMIRGLESALYEEQSKPEPSLLFISMAKDKIKRLRGAK